jgi:ribosomal protein S18 acetylase RimI-like enzyme
MNYLAFDTSDKVLRVLMVYRGAAFLHTAEEGFTHSERLMPAIEAQLMRGGCAFSDIEALGCVIGPGSFTGIRIGIATVKGLAAVRNLPVLAVNSALLRRFNGDIRACFDAEIAAGAFISARELLPVYLANPQAEGRFTLDVVPVTAGDIEVIAAYERSYCTDPETAEMLRARLTGNGRAACIRNGVVPAAYYAASIAGDMCDLETLAVARQYRGLGFANGLIDDLLGFARENNCSAVRLETPETNAAARALYEKRGWRRVGERKNYYSNGATALLYEREAAN